MDPRPRVLHLAVREGSVTPLRSPLLSWAFVLSAEKWAVLCVLWEKKQGPVGGAGHVIPEADREGAGRSLQEKIRRNGSAAPTA